MSTGYSSVRNVPHQGAVDCLVVELETRGYSVTECDVDGDGPDLWVAPTDVFVDVKTGFREDTGCATVKLGCLDHARVSSHTTIFVFADAPDCPVHTYESLCRRLVGGPRLPTGNGSNTKFQKVRVVEAQGTHRQTPFDEFFPPRRT